MINTALRKIAAPITNKSLLISVLLFTAIVIFAIFINTWNHFKQSFVQTQQALTFQSRLLERSITRTLESVEATILSIESVLAAESLNVGPENADDNIRSSEILRQQLDQSLHFSSHIRQIVITEGDRIIIDSSSRSEGSNINFHEMGLDFEDAAVRQRNQGLAFFSRSTSRFLPIMDDGSMAIRHSIFITGIQSGSYSSSGKPYWIFVALNPDYFVDFFLSETDDTDNSLLKNINIVDFEGNNLVSLLSATTEQSPVQSFLKSGYNQQYITTDYAVHALTTSETYPLIISISTSRKSILRQWWLENQNNLIWMSVLVSLLVFSGVTLMFEFRRRLTIQNQMVLLSSALEQSDAAILLTDSDQRIEYVNPSAERMFGYSASTLIGIKPSILASGDTDPTILKSLRDTIKKGENWQGELVNKTIDGRLKTVSTRISAVFSDSGYISHFVAVMEDITLRRQAESELQLAASVFSTAHEGILITNVDGVVININEAFTRITGYDREEILGKNPKILSSGLQDADFYKDMWHQLAVKGRWYGEIWNRRKNGEVYAELLSISAVRNNHEEVQHYVAMFSDITSIKEYQDRLEHIAHFDALTNLPNRVLLSDRLHQAMLRTMRVGRKMAVVFLDLDGFKEINDHYGHDNGDELLKIIAQRMNNMLRSGDTLSRIGGDEFIAVLTDLSSIDDSEPILNRLLCSASEPIYLGDSIVQVSASMGVTFYPQEESIDADQLQRQADQAMYQAKLAGKNRYYVFDAFQDRSLRGHHEKIQSINSALNHNEFILHYQPKINMRSGEVIGAEALIRWQHPERGLLAPAEFLPIIEDHPLAIKLGEWVIETALSQIENWQYQGLDIPISVNISALQLQHVDFIERLKALLSAHPSIPSGYLEIEVLETSALEDIDNISLVIEECRKLDVAFALDDFGTGYSSLTYLKRLSVKMLKIDKSFVRDMLYDRDDLSILEGVIGLANAFRRTVIAEGVETIEHGEMLLQLGCELAQGYGIARPMHADKMPKWIETWCSPKSWQKCQRLSFDKLMMLHATVEHRAWLIAFEHYLKNENSHPPPLDHHLCHYGQWLDNERSQETAHLPEFDDIDTLHQQVHFLAAELYQLHTDGQQEKALSRLEELYKLRDKLIQTMKNMLLK